MKNNIFHTHKTGIIAAFFLSLMISGCANLEIVNKIGFLSKESPRKCVDTVNIKGRFSIQYNINNKEESLHGGFTWEQTPNYTVVTLLSPLGQSMAKIEVTPQIATFLAPGRSPSSAPNADELIKSELGWALPVSGLRDWMQGCAIDMQGHSFIATPKSNQVITNTGWQINYVSWINGPETTLPKRIDLVKGNRDSLTGADLNLKLVIDEWHF